MLSKRASDSFFETPLAETLALLDVTRIVACGFQTELCADTTCRRATSLGYDVVLVSDGHGTCPNAVLDAVQIVAHHNATLDGFGTDRHAMTLRRSAEVMF